MQVKIERFKNLRDVEIAIDDLTLLVGGNNAGKSSVLQAIQFGASAAQTSSAAGGQWRNDRVSTSIGQSEILYSPIKDVLSLGYNGQLRQAETEQITITYTDGADQCSVSVSKGKNKNIRLSLEGQVLGEKLQQLQPPYCALVTGLAGIPAEEGFETKLVLRKAAAKGDSNSVFRNILLQLKAEPVAWAKFSEQLERVFPGYSVDVAFNPDVDEAIRCTVNRGGVPFPIDTCGTGVLQAIQIFSYVNLFKPSVLLLDEPDSHLHPNNQKQLAEELLRLSVSGLKVIVSTHSLHLIEALYEEARLIWMRAGQVEAVVPDYEIKALVEIGALNVGERLTNPDVVVLTEDANQDLVKLLLERSGFELDDCDVLSYSGCTNAGTAIALIEHVKRSHAGVKFIVHRDRDFLDQASLDRYKAQFVPLGAEVFIPAGNDLESYLAAEDHLRESCGIDAATAQAILVAAFNNRREELTKKYVNTRSENIAKTGVRPNAGELAVECNAQLNGPGSAAVHGKILLKGVRDELRRRGLPDRLLMGTAHLDVPDLRALRP